MPVKKVENLDQFHKVLKEAGDKLVVIDFTAVWCGPCKMIKPVFHKLSEEAVNKDVVFVTVDVDEARDVSSSCSIRCMPTFQFYKNGGMVFEFSGADKKKLFEKVAELR